MKITVTDMAIDHFWEEPPEDAWEFWAFLWPVKAKVGDPIFFNYNKKIIAKAVIAKIERPGESECDRTGNYRNRWKVYWTPKSFEDLREYSWAKTYQQIQTYRQLKNRDGV